VTFIKDLMEEEGISHSQKLSSL